MQNIWACQGREGRKKLVRGLKLALLNPEIPTCAECQKWLLDADWQKTKRAGEPIMRPPGTSPPCWKCPKSSDGKPNPAVELSDRNWHAINYARQCAVDSTGLLPRDATTIKNTALVRAIEERTAGQNDRAAMLSLIAAAIGGGVMKGGKR